MKKATIIFLGILLMLTFGCSREDANKVTEKAKEATTATKEAMVDTSQKASEMTKEAATATKEAASETAGKVKEMSK